jgi:hypothetical protein
VAGCWSDLGTRKRDLLGPASSSQQPATGDPPLVAGKSFEKKRRIERKKRDLLSGQSSAC